MKHPDHRLVTGAMAYTEEELAKLLGVTPSTVREWIARGLVIVDDRAPTLIEGHDVVSFLKARRVARARPCADGQLFCLRCRHPRYPKDRRAIYQPRTPTRGDLVGLCVECGLKMFRRVTVERLPEVSRGLSVEMQEAEQHI